MFTVLERRPISQELGTAADGWLVQHRLVDELDADWLELVCEDGEEFTTDKLLLYLAVPPCEIAVGDEIDVGRTQSVGEAWPKPGAPAGEVPRMLALARTCERAASGWTAACDLPGPIRELFTLDQPKALLELMNATRRTLGQGLLGIGGERGGKDEGEGGGTLTVYMVDGRLVARSSIAATIDEPFVYWVDSGPGAELAVPMNTGERVTGSLGGLSDLIFVNDLGIERRCFLAEDRPAPIPLELDGSGPRVRVDREGGLGREALRAIAELRPGEVTFTAPGDGSLVISGGAEGFTVPGPGAETDQPGVDIAVPYLMALALYDGSAGGPVELELGAGGGRLRREDLGLIVEWRR